MSLQQMQTSRSRSRHGSQRRKKDKGPERVTYGRSLFDRTTSMVLSRLFDPDDFTVDSIDLSEDGTFARVHVGQSRLAYLHRDEADPFLPADAADMEMAHRMFSNERFASRFSGVSEYEQRCLYGDD